MASITIRGPGLDGVIVETVVSMSDQAFLATVEAVNMLELGRLHESPGLFVIDKMIAGWKHQVALYQRNKGNAAVDIAVAAAIAPLEESVKVFVDGVDISTLVVVPEVIPEVPAVPEVVAEPPVVEPLPVEPVPAEPVVEV